VIYFAVALAAVSLPGCANFNSIYRELKTSEGSGALIDIKQRAIIAAKNDQAPFKVVVCAEASPDSLSAYAAELVGKADLPNGVSAQLASAFHESASFTGLRTQSIQLLRDSMYRTCEAFMNGAITQGQYDLLARRYQKHTVALLAIEQMTGAIKAPSVTINTNGSAEATRSLSEMRTAASAIDKQVTDLETKKGDKGTSDEDKNIIDQRIASLKSDKDAITKGIENARGVLVSGSSTAAISTVGVPSQRSDQHIQAVIGAVERIVQTIINTDDTGQLCFLQLHSDPTKLTEGGKQLQSYCSRIFELDHAASKLQIDAFQLSLENLKSSKSDAGKKADDAKKLAEQLDKLVNKTRLLSVPFKLPTE